MKRFNAITLALASSFFIAPIASAQQGSEAESVEEIIQVVGSRLSMRTATDGSAPVDIISGEDLAATGITETAKALQYAVPSFNYPSSSVTDGTDAVRPASLRGLSPDHTLVLINGKRRHSSALVHLNGTTGRGSSNVDLNAIPIAAIKRIEVLRDGAAALYGSDAIAGVINIVLKDNDSGGSANFQAGQTHKGDGEQWKLSASSGFSIGDDGAFTLSGELHHKNRTNRAGNDPRQQYPELPSGGLDPREETFDRQSFHVGDAEYENAALFANLDIGIGDGSFYAFGGISDRTSESGAFYRRALQSNTLTEIYPDGFLPILAPDVNDYSAYAGYEWAAGEWTLDFSGGYGFSKFQYNVENSLNASLGPDLTPTSFEAGTLENSETNLTFDAQRFIPFANNSELSLAMGISYRENSYEVIAGDEASYINGGYQDRPGGSQGFTGFTPESAVDESRDNLGVYVEAENQLTTDFMWGAAIRHEDYSDFGNNTSWKLSGRYDLTDRVAVRGAINTGFRAPSVQQLYFTNISTLFVDRGDGLEPEQSGTFNNISPVTQALGIGDLQPEESESVSLGMVWNGYDGLAITVDAFQIEIEDRIILSGDVSPVDSPAVEEALATTSAENARFFLNAVDTTTKGLDIVASKTFGVGAYGDLKAQLAYGYNNTEIDSINLPQLLDGLDDVLFDSDEQIRMTRSTPDHSGSIGLTHTKGKWTSNVQFSYFGNYSIGYTSGTETYGPNWITDVTVNYQWNDALALRVGAQNLFSEYPDERAEGNQFNGIFKYPLTNSPIGFNGGYFYSEVEYKF
ncbi:TonB-dependent receptor [Idiomarina abyssalis]|uniref:TonB-dependent receptor n=1 Tax=Idiomarina abyssalis TaxID=86102 RepID=A0A8I1KJ27_9GAMM|nr:TonB-dependent receptor [Idiomarina abyssalis]MBJ7266636.1 TonB-dependent receptor [Idiomarina abyssalis]MBJ7273097.1 TonB-dependent receptor [Idiomarina abyssalis]MBJ7315559.1 TonB-dependent receptor [Idiomarina abyssalis]